MKWIDTEQLETGMDRRWGDVSETKGVTEVLIIPRVPEGQRGEEKDKERGTGDPQVNSFNLRGKVKF